MVSLTLQKISSIFVELSLMKISREEAANWAIKQQKAFDF